MAIVPTVVLVDTDTDDVIVEHGDALVRCRLLAVRAPGAAATMAESKYLSGELDVRPSSFVPVRERNNLYGRFISRGVPASGIAWPAVDDQDDAGLIRALLVDLKADCRGGAEQTARQLDEALAALDRLCLATAQGA